MKVEPIGHPQSMRRAALTPPAKTSTVSFQPLTGADITAVSDAVAEPLSPIATSGFLSPQDGPTPIEASAKLDRGRAHGVLRKLEAGHFNGVADVRLRINFFDELSARAAQSGQATAAEESSKLADTVAERAGEMLQPFADDEAAQQALTGLIDGFESAVHDSIAQAAGAGQFDAGAVLESIQGAFDAFVGEVGALLAPSVDQPVPVADQDLTPGDGTTGGRTGISDLGSKGEDVSNLMVGQSVPNTADMVSVVDLAPDVTAAEPTTSLEDAVASLVASFDAALESLRESMSAAAALPDPSAPTGNGAAYDKFLAIYNAMRGVSGDVDHLV